MIKIFLSLFSPLFLGIILIISFCSITKYFNKTLIFNIFFDDYIIYVLKFTIKQSILSTIITMILAVPIACALHRRKNFFGKNLLLSFLNLSFILPAITIVTGIIIIHGKSGWINYLAQHSIGISLGYYLYGIFGIILGHLAFCLPLAVKLLLNALHTIPKEIWFIGMQLNLKKLDYLKIIYLPYLRMPILSLSVLIFMMCFTSFTIILALGGGPAVTSIEVAIYQSLKFDFDFANAINLSLIQFVICIFMMILLQKYNIAKLGSLSSYQQTNYQYNSLGVLTNIIDIILIFILFIVAILPTIAIIINGFNQKFFYILMSSEFLNAAGKNMIIAFLSGIISLIIAFGILSNCFYVNYILKKPLLLKFFILFANIKLIIPVFIFSTGLFIFFNQYFMIKEVSFYLIILLNAISSLPFVVNIILPETLGFSENEISLCRALGIRGLDFIKVIYLPKLAKSISQALAFSICMSFGDLSIIALFNNHNLITLPYLLYNKMSNYKLEEAAVISLMMIVISLILFQIIEKFTFKRLSC